MRRAQPFCATKGARHGRLAALTIPLVGVLAIPTISGAHAAPLWTLHGTVQTKDGKRVPNALVGLSIMPSGMLTTPTPTEYIAKVVTAPDGSFSIPAPSLSAAAIDQAVHNDGWLNLEIDAAPASPTICSQIVGCFGNVPDPAPAIAGAEGAVTYAGSYALSLLVTPSQITDAPMGTVRSAPNDIALTVYEIEGQPIPPATPCVSVSCIGAPQPANQCNYTAVDWHTIASDAQWEPVGEIHTWDDMGGSFSYGQTSSTDLGVAFDYGNGWVGGSGSVHVGNSVDFSVDPIDIGADTPQKVLADFAWAKDQGQMPGCAGGGTVYRIRGTDWTGGYKPGPLVPGNDGPSKYYSVDKTYRADIYSKGAHKNSGKNYKYTGEVTAFGIFSFSAETDYSSLVSANWAFGSQPIKHSLFAYGAPVPDANAQLIFASTEPLDPPDSVGGGGIWSRVGYPS